MDRMSRRLAAKLGAQEEASKHAYATYVAIEAVAKRFLTQRYGLHCCADALPRRQSRTCVLARRRQRECDPSLKHCRISCCCWQVRIGRKTFNVQGHDYEDWYVCAAATPTPTSSRLYILVYIDVHIIIAHLNCSVLLTNMPTYMHTHTQGMQHIITHTVDTQ